MSSNDSVHGIYVELVLLVVIISSSFTKVSIQYFLHTTITSLAALSAGTKIKSACNFSRVSLTSGWLRTLHFGDLHCTAKIRAH